MALIARDLMVGNHKLAEMGFGKESRDQCHPCRISGPEAMDGSFSKRRLYEAILTPLLIGMESVNPI